MKTHSLINSLINFRGNARGCVYSEPLNGIPYNLYTPFASVYMLALGVDDIRIGSIVSISWAFQLILALFSGAITDKLGRRRTTLIFDIISWSIPSLISAIAQNYWYFLGAAIINSICRIPQNSWMCLMVEDAEPDQLIDIFSWIYIAGLLSAFFAPLAGLMIKSFSLIPAMRVLYLFAAVCFTIKAIINYRMTCETQQGQIRMQETRQINLLVSIAEYKGVLNQILHSPRTLYMSGILAVMSICMMVNNSFWSIIVTQKIKIPVENIAIFTFVKSFVMLLFYFLVIPKMRMLFFKIPMMFGFLGFIISQTILISTPIIGYGWLYTSIIIEACSLVTLNPLVDRLMVISIDPKERARIQSILAVAIILITSPFGWVAGALSGVNKSLPFVMNLILFALGGFFTLLASRTSEISNKAEKYDLLPTA